MAWTVTDRWRNDITLTNERWEHITEGHWELLGRVDDVLKTIRLGRRRQDKRDPNKFRYSRAFDNLPAGYTHIVVIVRLLPNKFVITAYPKRIR